MTNEDRRVARTRRLLKQALVELANERKFDQITIRDITDRADIGYATFFRHYDGKEDLMLEIFTETIEELEALSSQHDEHYFEHEGYLLFSYAAENRALFRSIFDSVTFTRRLRAHVKDMVLAHIKEHASEIASATIPPEIAAQHMVSSLLGLIEWWLDHDQPYPVERMAGIYERLIVQATWHVLGEME